MALSRRFRRGDLAARRAEVTQLIKLSGDQSFGSDLEMIELADIMVESAVGYLSLPLGIATGFLIDNEQLDIPMATEEPSVIAAAGYGASIVSRGGGFTTRPGKTVTRGQIYLQGAGADSVELLRARRSELAAEAAPVLQRMAARGGGLVELDVQWLPESESVRIEFLIDVRDAMGANLVNTAMERVRPVAERLTGGQCLMAILSNSAVERLTVAECRVPVRYLERAGRSGAEMARRCELASAVAAADPHRAVTHNKGIMNGITALALATGNDTRALEAAAHSYAAESGRYKPLSVYRVEGDQLYAGLAVPIVLGTVGGAAEVHPTSGAARAVMGNPGAQRLACIAASLGLAQNLAAILALVGEGIQPGHMGLHAQRLAWLAGARGKERAAVVAALKAEGEFTRQAAERALSVVRTGQPETSGG